MKRKRLTDRQVELLCTLLPGPLTPVHAAFQITSASPGATGRVMNGLCKRMLAYEDEGMGGIRVWRVSAEGERWVRQNRDRVASVHRKLGFTNEEIASIYTHLV